MIEIKKVNEVYMKIETSEPSIVNDIDNHFTFMSPNAQFDSRFQSGKWDGKIHIFNKKTKMLYSGILFDLMAFLDKVKLPYRIDPELIPATFNVEPEDIKQLEDIIPVSSGGNDISLYDYQLEAVSTALNMQKAVLLAATSAGKSLVLYMWARIIQMQMLADDDSGKILIIVPRASLVEQLYSDFEDYSKKDTNWHCHTQCQKIASKYGKTFHNNIIISTWQSLAKIDPDVLNESIGAVAVDETHTASASSLKSTLIALKGCKYRIGVTGTLDNSTCNQMLIQGLLGPAVRIVSAKELMDMGAATKIKIDFIVLKYPEHVKEQLANTKKALQDSKTIYNKNSIPRKCYGEEMEIVESYIPRLDFIKDLTEAYEGNTMIFHNKLDQGALLEKHLDNTLVINGDVDVDKREEIRALIEKSKTDVNLIASFGTSSAGFSCKNLHNLIFASPTKSVVRVLQSVGRMMRLHETKDYAYIIDIVDDLGDDCYCLKQAEERLSYYYDQDFEVNFHEFDL